MPGRRLPPATRDAVLRFRLCRLSGICRLITALAVLTCIAPGAAGEPPASDRRPHPAVASETPQKNPAVGKLVGQLEDAKLTIRNEAERQLIGLGPSILEQLPQADERMSPELLYRLARVRRALERARAEVALQPSHVTLEGKLPLAEALAAIEKQTGNKLEVQGDLNASLEGKTVDVHFQQTPFWPALDQLLDQVGLTTYPFHQGPVLGLILAESGQRPRFGSAAYVSAFRFEAVRVEARLELRYPTKRALQVAVEVAWEPRLSPIGLTQPLADVHAVDSRGKPVAVVDPQIVLAPTVHRGISAVTLQMPFDLPPRSVANIAKLEAEMQTLMAGPSHEFRFDNLASARRVQQHAGDVTVGIDDVRKNNELWEVRLWVRYGYPAGALQSHRGWIFNNECFLVDRAGKKIEYAGLETTRQTQNEVGLAYLFDVPGGIDGASLVYNTATSLLKMPRRYTLEEIELP